MLEHCQQGDNKHQVSTTSKLKKQKTSKIYG